MKWILLLGLSVALPGTAEALNLDSASNNVELFYDAKNNNVPNPGNPDDDDSYDEYDYIVQNHRPNPIDFTTTMTECENCTYVLPTTPLRIPAEQFAIVGKVTRPDVTRHWSHHFTWDATDVPSDAPAGGLKHSGDQAAPH